MKRSLLACAIALASVVSVVSGATIATASAARPTAAPSDFTRDFTASLTARQEIQVPPVVSNATGMATFELSPDRTRLHFSLSARGLGRITQAHIHLGVKGVNGPPVAFLFPDVVNGVNGGGFVVEGTITSVDLIGPLGGQLTLDSLVQALESGGAYTNIHTVAHPGGEIRGQISAVDEHV